MARIVASSPIGRPACQARRSANPRASPDAGSTHWRSSMATRIGRTRARSRRTARVAMPTTRGSTGPPCRSSSRAAASAVRLPAGQSPAGCARPRGREVGQHDVRHGGLGLDGPGHEHGHGTAGPGIGDGLRPDGGLADARLAGQDESGRPGRGTVDQPVDARPFLGSPQKCAGHAVECTDDPLPRAADRRTLSRRRPSGAGASSSRRSRLFGRPSPRTRMTAGPAAGTTGGLWST